MMYPAHESCPVCKGARRVIVMMDHEGLNPVERMTYWLGFHRKRCPACGGSKVPREQIRPGFPASLPAHPRLVTSDHAPSVAGEIG